VFEVSAEVTNGNEFFKADDRGLSCVLSHPKCTSFKVSADWKFLVTCLPSKITPDGLVGRHTTLQSIV